tara:strand:- start:1656 stop:1979 length:324 start_codon:yes stop_codon:yes gene_type:complete
MWNKLLTALALSALTISTAAIAHPGDEDHEVVEYRGTILAIHDESEAPDYTVVGFIDVQLQLPDGNIENSVFETLLFPCKVEVGNRFVLQVDKTDNRASIICVQSNS